MFSIVQAVKSGDENFEVYGIYSSPKEAQEVWEEMEKEEDCLGGCVQVGLNLKSIKMILIQEELGVLVGTIEKILKLDNEVNLTPTSDNSVLEVALHGLSAMHGKEVKLDNFERKPKELDSNL